MSATSSRRRPTLLLGALVFGGALTIAVLRVFALSDMLGVRLSMPWAMNDFKTAIYCPVAIFLQGGNPYDRAQFLGFCPVQNVFPLYLPVTLLLHAPLGALPIDVATLLYFCLTVALSALIMSLCLRQVRGDAPLAAVLLATGVLLLTRPGQWNLLLGQPALELVLATYVALYAARRAPVWSGLALAVSLYKPTFGIPLAFLMLVRGDRKPVLLGVVVAAVANVVPLLVLTERAGGLQAFVENLIRSQQAWEKVVDPSTQVYGVDTPGLLSRLLGRRLAGAEYLAVSLTMLATTAAALWPLRRRSDAQTEHLSVAVICLGILVSVHHQAYDLVLLAAPVIALVHATLPGTFLTPARRTALTTLFVLLGLNYVTTQSVLQRFKDHDGLWLLLASLNGAGLLSIHLLYVLPLVGRGKVVATSGAEAVREPRRVAVTGIEDRGAAP